VYSTVYSIVPILLFLTDSQTQPAFVSPCADDVLCVRGHPGAPEAHNSPLPPRLPQPVGLRMGSTRLCLFTSFPWTAAHALPRTPFEEGPPASSHPHTLLKEDTAAGHRRKQEEGAPWVAVAVAGASERYGAAWSGVLWAADASKALLYCAPCATDLRNLAGLHDPARPGALVPLAAVLGAPGVYPAPTPAPAGRKPGREDQGCTLQSKGAPQGASVVRHGRAPVCCASSASRRT